MDTFVIEIAGLVTQVESLFESTRVYFHKYSVAGDPSFSVKVTEEDLLFEQKMLDLEAREEGLKLRKFSGPFLERAAIQRKIAEELLKSDTILLHGSTIGLDGAAYLFTAACGIGKSTHTRLWREVFGDRAVMINDDKPFIRISNDSVIAYGTPWSGKHGLDTNMNLPLKGICILHRGQVNRIWRISPDNARDMLLHQTFFSSDPDMREHTCELVDKLMRVVPLWSMKCNISHEAALVAHGAMSEIL